MPDGPQVCAYCGYAIDPVTQERCPECGVPAAIAIHRTTFAKWPIGYAQGIRRLIKNGATPGIVFAIAGSIVLLAEPLLSKGSLVLLATILAIASALIGSIVSYRFVSLERPDAHWPPESIWPARGLWAIAVRMTAMGAIGCHFVLLASGRLTTLMATPGVGWLFAASTLLVVLDGRRYWLAYVVIHMTLRGETNRNVTSLLQVVGACGAATATGIIIWLVVRWGILDGDWAPVALCGLLIDLLWMIISVAFVGLDPLARARMATEGGGSTESGGMQ